MANSDASSGLPSRKSSRGVTTLYQGFTAVNLRCGQAPLAQLAQWTTVFAIAAKEIERVLVLGEDEQLHLRVLEDAALRDEFAQPDELGLDLPLFERLCELDELAQFDDFLPQRRGIVRRYQFLQFREYYLLFVFRQVVEVVGESLINLALAVAFGVGENQCALFLLALKAPAHGVEARSEPALKHRHREAERATARGILRRGFNGLVFDVTRASFTRRR